MSKYSPLSAYLEKREANLWVTTFEEIERILGFRLPRSARDHQAWWANSHDNSPQHQAWLDSGWRTEDVNLSAGHVTFRRSSGRSQSSIHREKAKPPRQAEVADLAMWANAARHLNGAFRMTWRPLGMIRQDASGRLRLPDAPATPGLYCFRIREGNGERRYFGESSDLARRFGHYRNPGPSQQTNIRVNAVLRQALGDGADIAVEIVSDDAWIDWGKGPEKANLTLKAARCLLENAAILEGNGSDIESLNRYA